MILPVTENLMLDAGIMLFLPALFNMVVFGVYRLFTRRVS